MKKLSLSSFEEDVLKSDISKKITGGYYNEGYSSDTSQCTWHSTYGFFEGYDGDNTSDGDYYSSC
ncbi:hypothetical protein [Flagellimonas meridianipacifica]|uniref:Uncharacterized protein n=1 Tax=Flagellimonas meridianipacifica TaxID=1080225 RepID=A0A2T0MCN5_9FLAO|nr:hypothetical protein [Allomuricauda pacifica]PRX55257.1 hypothetical protein CLV81_3666 [Allomuricauda pacifica]